MNLSTEAIYENGVLRLIQPVALPEGTRVSVVITTGETVLPNHSATEILAESAALPLKEIDAETSEWLEAELVEELPPYDWGGQEIPQGKTVHYAPGTGFVVEGGKSLG